MIFYRVDNLDIEDAPRHTYYATKDDAHNAVKQRRTFNNDTFVDQVELPDDKAGILAIINGRLPPITPTRTWILTGRGGLKEITVVPAA